MKIIICDDDPDQRELIRICFTVSGIKYEIVEFTFGAEVLDYLATREADLVFLDIGLPDIDGLDVLRRIRSFSDIPVIVVSVYDALESVARALADGADDYIIKPFEPIELMARVEAVTRRTSGRISERAIFTSPGLLLDFDRKVATVEGEQVELNSTEWNLLRSLTSDPGAVVNYSSLKQKGWGEFMVSDAAVHMAVRRLRQKLNQATPKDSLIRTHRGVGYSVSTL